MVPSSLLLRNTRLHCGLVKLAEGLGLVTYGVDPVPSSRIAVTWSPVFPFTNLGKSVQVIVAQIPGVTSVTEAAIESEGNTLLGFARGVLTVDLDKEVKQKLMLKDFSFKFTMNGMWFTLSMTHPCAVCGEDDHQTRKCAYPSTLRQADLFGWKSSTALETSEVPPMSIPTCAPRVMNATAGPSRQPEADPTKVKKSKRLRKEKTEAKAEISEPMICLINDFETFRPITMILVKGLHIGENQESLKEFEVEDNNDCLV
ncbi:hypothetical protein K443DRAFT_12605 [Laccaria amethystina LaAM-08-1]|uniref:Uncharacterized protein n=1 Tax=Laccaria amethystina LaAM-08-1 TaxID=1095629 RepID=A0A0C9WIZ2_9AGAR|nr:hypothetical protein K443DRAFT_12605 [Laccaria amethystina LaAM-08-1]